MMDNTKRWLGSLLALFTVPGTTIAYGGILADLDQGKYLSIAAIGTSLTAPPDQGGPMANPSPWMSQMGAWLETLYPGQISLHNEAIGASASKYTDAYTSPGSGLDVQLGKALAHNPDAIFIEFAINDAYAPYAISPQASKDNLQTMIDRIREWSAVNHNDAEIIVQTMNNVIEQHAVDRPTLSSYYEGYRTVAAANGLLLVDHYKNWSSLYNSDPMDHAIWNSYVPDGIHPNDLGVQNVILPEIQRVLTAQTHAPEPGTLVLAGAGVIGWLISRLSLVRTAIRRRRHH